MKDIIMSLKEIQQRIVKFIVRTINSDLFSAVKDT